jgi:hypothetical protein
VTLAAAAPAALTLLQTRFSFVVVWVGLGFWIRFRLCIISLTVAISEARSSSFNLHWQPLACAAKQCESTKVTGLYHVSHRKTLLLFRL